MTVPRSRVLSLVSIVGGLVVAVLLLVVPVKADFSDDVILNLRSFDRQPSLVTTEVDCGPAPTNVLEPGGGGSIYDIARDDACHRVGYRRFWVAIASGATLVSGGLVGLVAAGRQP